MANGNQLSQAYSILGQATTAEYNRRRREEEEYRRRARRDQLLGYVLAPIGAEIGKGVSDIISAPFKDATEKFLATEQGRALNKDIKAIDSRKTAVANLQKEINTKYQGSTDEYFRAMNIQTTDREVLADWMSQGYSEQQLTDGKSDISRNFLKYRETKRAEAEALVPQDVEEYNTAVELLSGYKVGQDAKEVVEKTNPYAKGWLGGAYNVGKRILSGVSPLEAMRGPTDTEKKNSISRARELLNLTEEEVTRLNRAVSLGIKSGALDREIESISVSKDPDAAAAWNSLKQEESFKLSYKNGTLAQPILNMARKLQAENDIFPTKSKVYAALRDKYGTVIENYGTQNAENRIKKGVESDPRIGDLKTKFFEDLKRGGIEEKEIENRWNNVVSNAYSSVSTEFYNNIFSSSDEQFENVVIPSFNRHNRVITATVSEVLLSGLEKEKGKATVADWLFGSDVEDRFTGYMKENNINFIERIQNKEASSTVVLPAGTPTLEQEATLQLMAEDISSLRNAAKAGASALSEQVKAFTDNGYDLSKLPSDLTEAINQVSKSSEIRVPEKLDTEAPVFRRMTPYIKGLLDVEYRTSYGFGAKKGKLDVSNYEPDEDTLEIYAQRGVPIPENFLEKVKEKINYWKTADEKQVRYIEDQITLLDSQIKKGEGNIREAFEKRDEFQRQLTLLPVGYEEIQKLEKILIKYDPSYQPVVPQEEPEQVVASSLLEPIPLEQTEQILEPNNVSMSPRAREILNGIKSLITPRGQTAPTPVVASSLLEPIPLEQTDQILETEIGGRKVLRGKSISPRSQMVIDRVKDLITTKEGDAVVSQMAQEVKKELGVELDKQETQQVIVGLIEPTSDQVQGILDILSTKAPIKGMTMQPSQDQINGLLKILSNIKPSQVDTNTVVSDEESESIDQQLAKNIADSVKALKGFESMKRSDIEKRIKLMRVPSDIRDLALQLIFQ